MKQNFIKFLGKMSSRKFYIEVIATVALFLGKINGREWIVVSCIYIGGNVLKSLVEILGKKPDIV